MPLNVSEPSQISTTTESTPASRAAKRLKTGAAWALGLSLLAWLLSRTPFEQVRQAIERPQASIWALTLTALLASYALRAARLQVVLDLDAGGHPTRRWLGLRTDALRVILMHNAAVNLLPMRAGELSFPWLASRELSLPLPRALACLMWMRAQDLVVLLLLGIALWPGPSLVQRALALAAAALLWWACKYLLARWFVRHSALPDGSASGLNALMQRLRAAMLEPAHHKPAAWGLTLANWSLKLAAGATLLSAISTAPWSSAWAGALGGELAAIVPLQGPAGFGTYEAGVWAGMATNLAPQSPALAQAVGAALALHVCFLLCAVIAGALASWISWLNKPGQPSGPSSSRHVG